MREDELVTEELARIVTAQAAARVRGDDATFASYMTPTALLQLRFLSRRGRRFDVLEVTGDADSGESAVRYRDNAGSYVVRQRWSRSDGLWRSVGAVCPPEMETRSLWAKATSLFSLRPVRRLGRV